MSHFHNQKEQEQRKNIKDDNDEENHKYMSVKKKWNIKILSSALQLKSNTKKEENRKDITQLFTED